MPNIHSTISFGLVNIPVVMNSIVHNNDASFHQLHKKCLKRIKYVKYCPHCKVDVKEVDIVKGFEYERDVHIVFSKQELNRLKPENDGILDIVSFVSLKEIDPAYFEKSYFLTPEKKSKAYSLFCKALEKSNLVALCKTVLHSKFYYAIIRSVNEGMVLTTLYFDEEISFEGTLEKVKVEAQELNLAIKLISQMKGKFEPALYKDEYQDNVSKAIGDKLKGEKVKRKRKKTSFKANDLMKALEKSLKS